MSGDSKLGHMYEIKMLGHGLGEHRAKTETKETEVFDCFSVRAH